MKGLLAVAAFAVVAALAAAAAAEPTQSVTLDVHRFYSETCSCYRLEFSGMVSSGEPNEQVVVMQQKCGRRVSTAAADVSTVEGGLWTAEVGLPFSHDSATYRAHWNGRLSEPWTFRPKLTVWPPAKLRGRRVRVSVFADPEAQTMRRRFVQLQRRSAGRWIPVRRARLAANKRFAGQYSATFTVLTRGLRMRFLVPAKSAAPCYSATVTDTFVS